MSVMDGMRHPPLWITWEPRLLVLALFVGFALGVFEGLCAHTQAQVSSGPALVGCYNAREELCEPCGKR